jgi:hypothetical protein
VCSPDAIAGHPCDWAAVGVSNVVENHVRTGSLNRCSTSFIRAKLPVGGDVPDRGGLPSAGPPAPNPPPG